MADDRLPMDAPREVPLRMRDISDEERRELVGALMARFVRKLDERRQMAAREEIIRQMLEEQARKKVAFHIPAGLKRVLPYAGVGSAIGGLSGYASTPPGADPSEGRVGRTIAGALSGGVTGGLLGHVLGPSGRAGALTNSPAQQELAAGWHRGSYNPELLREIQAGKAQSGKALKMETPDIVEKIKSKVKGHAPAPSAAELEQLYKSSALVRLLVKKAALPAGMTPAHLGALIGGAGGGLAGLFGAKAIENEDDSYGSKLLKRLGMGAAGMAGGAMLGGAFPMGKAIAQHGGGVKALAHPWARGALWDEAKTAPIEAAKKVPGWIKGMWAGAPKAAADTSDEFTTTLQDEMNQMLGKTAVVKRKGDDWELHTSDGSRVLGTHDTARKAYAQEKAIEMSKARKKTADLIPGGKADNKADKLYNKKQIAKGVKTELEHVDSKAEAKEIAKDHLEEQREAGKKQNYYDKLQKMEGKHADGPIKAAAGEDYRRPFSPEELGQYRQHADSERSRGYRLSKRIAYPGLGAALGGLLLGGYGAVKGKPTLQGLGTILGAGGLGAAAVGGIHALGTGAAHSDRSLLANMAESGRAGSDDVDSYGRSGASGYESEMGQMLGRELKDVHPEFHKELRDSRSRAQMNDMIAEIRRNQDENRMYRYHDEDRRYREKEGGIKDWFKLPFQRASKAMIDPIAKATGHGVERIIEESAKGGVRGTQAVAKDVGERLTKASPYLGASIGLGSAGLSGAVGAASGAMRAADEGDTDDPEYAKQILHAALKKGLISGVGGGVMGGALGGVVPYFGGRMLQTVGNA